MSVPTYRRGKQKFEVITKALGLADYTLKICKNEKHFPKRDRWLLTSKIVDSVMHITECVRKANAIRIITEEDYNRRRTLQMQSYEECEWLLTLIDISYRNLNLASDRVEYWSKLVVELEALISSWRKSDRDNYKKKISNPQG